MLAPTDLQQGWNSEGKIRIGDHATEDVRNPDLATDQHADPPGTEIMDLSPDRPEGVPAGSLQRSEEHTSELQSLAYLVCRLLLEKKKKKQHIAYISAD